MMIRELTVEEGKEVGKIMVQLKERKQYIFYNLLSPSKPSVSPCRGRGGEGAGELGRGKRRWGGW